MKKPIPTFKSDQEAEEFVADADLTEYDLSGAQLVRFEMKPKTRSISRVIAFTLV
jgi:predicted DNA binding CopG/RHH family protein